MSVALAAPGREPLLYRDVPTVLEGLRQWTADKGCAQGDVIGLVMPNGPEMALTLLGCSMHCTVAPIDPAFGPAEVKAVLQRVGARAVVVSAHARAAMDAAAQLGVPALAAPLAEHGPIGRSNDLALRTNRISPVSPDHVMIMLQTSGTTGQPKRVPLRMANIGGQACNMSDSMALAPTDSSLVMMPLFHMHGFSCITASLWSGGRCICTPGYDPSRFFNWLLEQRPTWYSAVPTVHADICQVLEREPTRAKGHALKFVRSLSAALPAEVRQCTEQHLGVAIVEHYGLSEALSPLTIKEATSAPGAVGKPYRCDIIVADELGAPAAMGQEGEVLVRGDVVIAHYAEDDTVNAASFHGGWLRTGDLGKFDANGNLYITGRLKEIINRGGEKISPHEVESVAAAYPGIKQAAVFGVAHSTLGEDVAMAYTVNGLSVGEGDLRRWLQAHLAPHKVPKRFIKVDSIPATATGKVKRAQLADLLGLAVHAVRTSPDAGIAYEEIPTNVPEHHPGPKSERAPTKHLEQAVAMLWAQVLRRERIYLDDDFFALGGDSLSGVRVCSQLKELHGYDVSLAHLFRAPTLAQFVAQLGSQGRQARWTNLAPIRMQGGLTPFVCIHGDDGNYNLPRYLRADRPFIGFMHQGEDGRGMKYKSIPAIAQHYVDELTSAIAHGPYILAGFSMGGIIAFEMAHILRRMNQHVALLTIIDTRGPRFPWWRYAPKTKVADAKATILRPRCEALLRRGEPIPYTLRNFYIINTYRRAMARYKARPYQGDVLLIRSSQRTGKEPTGWNGLFAGKLFFEVSEGAHLTMLREPNVREFAGLLEKQLKSKGL